MANGEKIISLQVPFPDFKLGDVIEPEEFDSNNQAKQDKINEIVDAVNTYLLSVANNTPGNSYYTKNEVESVVEFGSAKVTMLDGGSFHDLYTRPTSVDGGSFEETLSSVLIYDGGEF